MTAAAILQAIDTEIHGQGLSQRKVAEVIGVSQPKISMMLRGQHSYTEAELSDFLAALQGNLIGSSSPAPAKKTKSAPAATARPAGGRGRKKTSDDDSKAKLQLVKQLNKAIQAKGLSQRAVGELLGGMAQPKVSLLLKGRGTYAIDVLEGYIATVNEQPGGGTGRRAGGRKKATVAPVATMPPTLDTPAVRVIPQVAVKASTKSEAPADAETWMREEIAYLKELLNAVLDKNQSDRSLQAELQQLQRENAELREKSDRFNQMTALLQNSR
jgi:predicted XRE-type DNA-binding protein